MSLLSSCDVPIFNDTITGCGCHFIDGREVLGKCIDTVSVTITQCTDKGLSKDSFELCGVQCSSILSSSLEWMEFRIQVSWEGGFSCIRDGDVRVRRT